MVRLTDILKKAKEKKKEKQEQVQSVSASFQKKRKEGSSVPEFQVSAIGNVTASQENIKLYEEILSLTRDILKDDIDYKSIAVKKITAQLEKIIDGLKTGNEDMLLLALEGSPQGTDKNYLYYHALNTCIFSFVIGLGLGYDMSELIELGISAILHDIGLIKYLDLITRRKKLTPHEYIQIKKHARDSVEMLEKFAKDLPLTVIQAIHQHHERIDGSGYPRGLEIDLINEYAMILGLVDVYDALIHSRVYRPEYSPLEAVQEILKHKKSFEYKLIKILIESIGLFPIGTFVELNSKEIVQVVKSNHEIPLRPVVKIIYGANGEKLKDSEVLDLAKDPNKSIKRAVKRSELEHD